MEYVETLFLGGGLSCLTAAGSLGKDCLVLEKEARPGGLCRSDTTKGFTFDRTGHLLHLRHEKTRALVRELLGGKLAPRSRNTWIYSHGAYTRYPYQSNFHGLPTPVLAECLEGFIKAHCRAQARAGKKDPLRFDRWVLDRFGPGVAKHFLFPYNQKLWTVSPATLTTEWLGRFVPRPDLSAVLRGALEDQPNEEGYNAHFLYPKKGGIEVLVRALARRVPRLRSNAEVVSIDLKKRQLSLRGGETLAFGRLVSSLPLKELVRITRPLPEGLRKAAAKLRAASVYNLNLGIRDPGSDRHWIYLPEPKFSIYRFGFSSNFSKHMAPEGAAGVYTEWAYRGRRPDPDSMRRKILADLKTIGIIRSAKDILAEKAFDLKVAYAIYDRARGPAVRLIRGHLETRGIHPVGRYGRWEYSSMEDALLQGMEVADIIRNN